MRCCFSIATNVPNTYSSLCSFLSLPHPAASIHCHCNSILLQRQWSTIVRVASIYLRYLFNRCLNQTIHLNLTSIFILLRPSTADQYCFTLHGPSKGHRHSPPKRPQRELHVRRPTRSANSLPRRQMGNGMFVVLSSVIPAWYNISNNYSPLLSHSDSTITVSDERLGWRNRRQ